MTVVGIAPSCASSITSGTVPGMPAPEKPSKVEENRVRRMATRQNLKLEKSALRDPYALGFGTYRLRASDGSVTAGHADRGRDYGLSLADVEAHLTGQR